VAISTDGCNDKPTQFSGAKVGSGNYKNGICALSCAPLDFGLLVLPQICTVNENVKALLCNYGSVYCFTISIGLLAMNQTTMKTKGRKLQRTCKTM